MRNKVLLLITLLILSIIVVVQYNMTANQVYLDYEGNYISEYVWISSEEWNSIDNTNSGYVTPEELLVDIDRYIEEVSRIINEDWIDELQSSSDNELDSRIRVKFTYDISRAYGGGAQKSDIFIRPSILLNVNKYENGEAPIVHELTHVISPYSISRSFNEGLACYIQDEIGANGCYPNYGKPVDEIASEYLESEYDYLIHYLGNSRNGDRKLYTSDRNTRGLFYIFSSSLSRYIISEYGIDTYMELYNSNFEDRTYIELFSINRDQLISNWKKSILSSQK